MIFGKQRAQLAETAGDDFKNRLFRVRRHFLLQMRDPERIHAPDIAIVRRCRAGNYAKQSRLARAVAADEANPLAGIDLKVDMGQQRLIAVGQRNIIQSDYWHGTIGRMPAV